MHRFYPQDDGMSTPPMVPDGPLRAASGLLFLTLGVRRALVFSRGTNCLVVSPVSSLPERRAMKDHFVDDGRKRLFDCPEYRQEYRARMEELRASVESRHAAEWAAAGFFARLLLVWRMASEYRRECRKLAPSEYSLFARDRSK